MLKLTPPRVIYPKRQPRNRHYQVSFLPATKSWQFVAKHNYENGHVGIFCKVPADGSRRGAIRLMELQLAEDKENGLY